MKRQITYIFSLVFVVLGIIGIIVGVLKWEDVDKEEIKGRLGIIIDAGGSGTRLIIYEYKKDNSLHQINYIKCEDKGMTSYVSHPDQIKALLTKCLEKAEKDIPTKVRSSVPINMEATAGMRVLKLMNESAYNAIWSVARNTLSRSQFHLKKAGTIKGSEEGVNAWVSLNVLKKGFLNKKLTGALEMGSTSLQVSFIPADKNFKGDNMTVSIDGKKYTVYAHSYLCYGRGAFERRYLAKLVVDSGYASTVNDPCAHKGQQFTKNSDYLWAVPCSSGPYAKKTFGVELKGPPNTNYVFNGQSNFTECQKSVKKLLNTTVCNHESCSFNGVSQPPVHGDFLAFSAFYYPVNFLNLSSNVKLPEYTAASKRICSLTAAEAREIPGSAKFAYSYCLSSVYAISFLTKGIHFNESNWNLEFNRKINGQSISWTLGSQYRKKDEMSSPVLEIIRKLTRTEFSLIMSICSVSILVGIIVFVVTLRRRSKR